MEKIFVLDTNVILFDPQAIFKFGKDNTVFIPLIVVEEVDRFKKDQNENGRNARHFSRLVDELRKKARLRKESTWIVEGNFLFQWTGKNIEHLDLLDLDLNDNVILSSALTLQENGNEVTLISKDINLRLKADVIGLKAEDYGKQDVSLDELYSGRREVEVPVNLLEQFQTERFLPDDLINLDHIFPNEYILVCEENNPRHRVPGRYSAQKKGIVPLITMREESGEFIQKT